jgi:hypothetical protein
MKLGFGSSYFDLFVYGAYRHNIWRISVPSQAATHAMVLND